MKKILLLTLAILPLAVHGQRVVPGSSFPITNPPPDWATFLMVDTNGQASANSLTRSNLQFRWDAMKAALTAIINPTFPWLIVTNNSPDFVIQAQFNSLTNGGFVAFQPGSYTITNSLRITNSLTIFGDGATLHYSLLSTNPMLTTSTNYGKTLVIDNLIFDGQIYSTYNDNTHHLGSSGIWDPYYNPYWTNRSGLYVEASGGVRVQNCVFAGWPGNGCIAVQKGGSFTSQTTPKFEFLFNRCWTNMIGVFVVSAGNDVPGYYASDSSLWQNGYGAEYALIEGNDFFQNQFGIIGQAGNALVQGNTVNANFFGIFGSSGDNSQHGRWCGNTINHNQNGVYSESSGASNSSMVQDNAMLANVNNCVYNGAQGFIFCDNWIGSGGLIATNGSSGVIINNRFQFNGKWGVDMTTNLSSNIILSGNISQDGTNTDGSLMTFEHQSKPSFFTNTAPTSVTVGTTAADKWIKTYDSLGNFIGYSPVWTNH